MRLASSFLPSMSPWRAIMTRWAWGEASPVEGLGAVTHSPGAQGEVLNEAEDAHAVLGGGAGAVLHVLLDPGAGELALEVGVGQAGAHSAANQVFGDPGHLVGKRVTFCLQTLASRRLMR